MRTSPAQVKSIIDVGEEFDLSPFIEIANELITEHCSDKGYTESRLEMIERYMSAHLYTNYDPRTEREAVGGVSVNYQSSVGLGFDSSFYGQTAMRLDTSGGLAALNNSIQKQKITTPSASWLGSN